MTAQPTTEKVWSDLSTDLRRFIRRRVADEHVTDDLLQETFVRIHRRIDSLEQADQVAAWVYRIARNVIHDYFRRRNGSAVELGDTDPAEEPGVGWSHFRNHAHMWLHELIQQLPERYRDAVRLSEIEGLAQQEVANRLGLSLSGAKSRIQRGRVMLRNVLDQCCTFQFDRQGSLLDCDPKPGRTVCHPCHDLDLPPISDHL